MRINHRAIYEVAGKEYGTTPSHRLMGIINILPNTMRLASGLESNTLKLESDDSLEEGLYYRTSSRIIYKLSI